MQAYLHLIETVSAVTLLSLGAFTFLPDLYVDCLVSATMPIAGGVVARQACANLSRASAHGLKIESHMHCTVCLVAVCTCACTGCTTCVVIETLSWLSKTSFS